MKLNLSSLARVSCSEAVAWRLEELEREQLEADRRRARRTSLDLLPSAALPGDLAWAGGNPSIAGAFARASAAVGEAGARSVPEAVRDLVVAEVLSWDGRPVGPSRAWVADAVAALPASDRPAGRLTLLTALASYQVDDEVIDDVRSQGGGDQSLVELVAWAAMTTARELGRRMWTGMPAE